MANSTIMHLIAKNGKRIDFDRRVVCAQSPVLNARTTGGGIGIDVNHEEHAVKQTLDWMHGIGGEHHLTGGQSVDEISASGPTKVSTKLSALIDIGKIATEYEVVALRERVVGLIEPLVLNIDCVEKAHIVLHELAPKNVPAPLMQAVVLRASILYDEQVASLEASASAVATQASSARDRATQTTPAQTQPYPPLPMYRPPASMIRMTGASAPSPSPTSASSANKRGAIRNDSAQDPITIPSDDDDDDEEEEEEEDETSTSPPTSPRANRQRTVRKEPASMSTALPINNPRLGDHCDCLVAKSDPTLVVCKGCAKYFHPRCQGRGRYASSSCAKDPMFHMMKDVELFEDEEFRCLKCRPGYFDNAPGKRRTRNSMGGGSSTTEPTT